MTEDYLLLVTGTERDWAETAKRYLDVVAQTMPREVAAVRQLWAAIVRAVGVFPLPAVTMSNTSLLHAGGRLTGEALHLSWVRGHHALSFEIHAAHWEWFYRDRQSGRFDGDGVKDFVLPDQVKFLLCILKRAK